MPRDEVDLLCKHGALDSRRECVLYIDPEVRLSAPARNSHFNDERFAPGFYTVASS